MLETLKADDRTAELDSCTTPFLLSDLEPGKRDKLGNTVQEILWLVGARPAPISPAWRDFLRRGHGRTRHADGSSRVILGYMYSR
jgi:hypothetical protein